jgi:hypothetical protein
MNGVAECMNRTLTEKARCLLVESGLGMSFWAEAIFHAANIVNQTVNLGSSETFAPPYELFNGVKPDVSFLKVFGCVCYSFVPNKNATPSLTNWNTRYLSRICSRILRIIQDI